MHPSLLRLVHMGRDCHWWSLSRPSRTTVDQIFCTCSHSPHPYTLRLARAAARQSAWRVLTFMNLGTEFSHKVQCHWVQWPLGSMYPVHHIVRYRARANAHFRSRFSSCMLCVPLQCSWLARVMLFFLLQYHHLIHQFRLSSKLCELHVAMWPCAFLPSCLHDDVPCQGPPPAR
jgi:hypothetical protein